jgi:anti-sigma regulatory factor (Ser/Thr protein kinase)
MSELDPTWGGEGDPRSGRRAAITLGNLLAFSVTGGVHAASGARDELRERLGAKIDPSTIELAQLLLSELVNNCVLHGAAAEPDSWIDVSATTFPQMIRVEVSDGGPTFRHDPVLPAFDAGSGRGLYLVEQLSSRWGISARGIARVWFELPRKAVTVSSLPRSASQMALVPA